MIPAISVLPRTLLEPWYISPPLLPFDKLNVMKTRSFIYWNDQRAVGTQVKNKITHRFSTAKVAVIS